MFLVLLRKLSDIQWLACVLFLKICFFLFYSLSKLEAGQDELS